MSRVVEIYKLTRKRPDLPWNTYVCPPLAAIVVALLEHRSATPNQVTLAAFVVAAGAAAMLASWPGYLGLVLAVVVYELSYVLDCADGMLARLRGVQSKEGHLLDFLMDEIKAFMVLAAVAVRLHRQHESDLYLLLGLGGLVCLASGIAITTFERRPEIAVEVAPSPAQPGNRGALRWLMGLPLRFAKLLIHYPSYILIVALSGHIEAYFFPYIAVNAVYFAKAFAGVSLRFGRSGSS